MAAKTLATYIGELTAVTSLGAGDKILVLESSTVKYVEGNDVGGAAAWGAITGTLSNQTDLNTALGTKQASDADLTTIVGLTPADDDFLQRKAGAWANRTVSQVKTDLGVPTYARYVALLSQTGTDAPVATVLENTLGGTVVWTRNDVGDYTGTLAGVFVVGKTFLNSPNHINTGLDISFRSDDANTVSIITADSGMVSDEILLAACIEIRVYP